MFLILDDIIEMKKIRVEKRKKEIPMKELEKQALCRVENEVEASFRNPFIKALRKDGLSVIGEFKRHHHLKALL